MGKIKQTTADEFHWRIVEDARRMKLPERLSMEEALLVLARRPEAVSKFKQWRYGNVGALDYQTARELIKRKVKEKVVRKERRKYHGEFVTFLVWPIPSFSENTENRRPYTHPQVRCANGDCRLEYRLDLKVEQCIRCNRPGKAKS